MKLFVPTEAIVPPIQWQLQKSWIRRAVRPEGDVPSARTATRSPTWTAASAIGPWRPLLILVLSVTATVTL